MSRLDSVHALRRVPSRNGDSEPDWLTTGGIEAERGDTSAESPMFAERLQLETVRDASSAVTIVIA
jgi:hypothetical protein